MANANKKINEKKKDTPSSEKGKYKLGYKIEKFGVQTPKKKVYLNLYEGWTKMKLQVRRKNQKKK